MASRYAFVTEWLLPAGPDRVWGELMAPEEWPTWWRGVERVELLRNGDPLGVGAIRRYTWRSRLPYRLSFDMETTRVDPGQLLEGRATGELAGRGCWRLWGEDGATRVRYEWEVQVAKAWMRLLDPVARPLFAWNHDVVMEWGRQGLVRRLAGDP